MHRRFLTMENMSRLLQFSSHLVTGRWLGSLQMLILWALLWKTHLFPSVSHAVRAYILYSVISSLHNMLPSTNACVLYRIFALCQQKNTEHREEQPGVREGLRWVSLELLPPETPRKPSSCQTWRDRPTRRHCVSLTAPVRGRGGRPCSKQKRDTGAQNQSGNVKLRCMHHLKAA